MKGAINSAATTILAATNKVVVVVHTNKDSLAKMVRAGDVEDHAAVTEPAKAGNYIIQTKPRVN